jgi:TM2 domain-containing membrane protein YozV
MSKAWKNLNLEGGGLQAVNAVLAANLRSRGKAYAAWLLFPAGLHRIYLGDTRGSALFLLLSATTLITAFLVPGHAWLVPLLCLLGLAVYDLFQIEDRLVTYNKDLRMRLFLRKGQRPPTGYQGRYPEPTADGDVAKNLEAYALLKERERAGHPPQRGAEQTRDSPSGSRVPSFNEQEALLRQLSRSRKDPK